MLLCHMPYILDAKTLTLPPTPICMTSLKNVPQLDIEKDEMWQVYDKLNQVFSSRLEMSNKNFFQKCQKYQNKFHLFGLNMQQQQQQQQQQHQCEWECLKCKNKFLNKISVHFCQKQVSVDFWLWHHQIFISSDENAGNQNQKVFNFGPKIKRKKKES